LRMPKPRKPTKQAEAMALQMSHNKKALLEALEKSLNVVTTACKNVGVERTTFYRYLRDDPEFAGAVKALDNVALDFAESSLHKQIQAGVPSSTIFYLKTKGKERGYVERQEHSGPDGKPIQTESRNPDLSKLTTKELLALKELNEKLAT
jgi:hypothetical protein